MNLSLFLLIPSLTALMILCGRGMKQIRIISLIGASIQLLLSGYLLVGYINERATGDTSAMLFEDEHAWFSSLNINYHIGVDGISVAMILLTAFVVIAGVLISWSVETKSKEYFFLLMLLSVGAYGFLYHSTYS